jgi:hypothetical protein
MEPISGKVGGAGTTAARQGLSEGQKTGPSKFDRIRADLNQELAGSAQLPPKVTNISDQQKELLKNDLRRKLENGNSPQQLFGGEMRQVQAGIADLNRRVAAVPNSSALGPLQDQLKSIESDFNASAKLLNEPVSGDNPTRLLEMQMQVYKLSQNVEIMSRTVSEAMSGVKTVLQTQV